MREGFMCWKPWKFSISKKYSEALIAAEHAIANYIRCTHARGLGHAPPRNFF